MTSHNMQLSKEPLQKSLCRHAGENRHPVTDCFHWIPVFAGMTKLEFSELIQRFPNNNASQNNIFINIHDISG